MCNQSPNKSHFFASIFKYDPWILWLTAKAVWGHDHGKVVHVHLCNCSVFISSKYLINWEGCGHIIDIVHKTFKITSIAQLWVRTMGSWVLVFIWSVNFPFSLQDALVQRKSTHLINILHVYNFFIIIWYMMLTFSISLFSTNFSVHLIYSYRKYRKNPRA